MGKLYKAINLGGTAKLLTPTRFSVYYSKNGCEIRFYSIYLVESIFPIPLTHLAIAQKWMLLSLPAHGAPCAEICVVISFFNVCLCLCICCVYVKIKNWLFQNGCMKTDWWCGQFFFLINMEELFNKLLVPSIICGLLSFISGKHVFFFSFILLYHFKYLFI